MAKAIRVLMCGSDIQRVKGGMVTVVCNYLQYGGWEKSGITYLATHTEGSRARKTLRFAAAGLRAAAALLRGRYDLVHLHIAERGSFYRKALLVRLAGDWGLRDRLSREGHRLVAEGFSLSQNIRQLEGIYERLVKDAAG